jgi:hypothetical protein
MSVEELFDYWAKIFSENFTGKLTGNSPARIDQNQGWPGSHRVLVPYNELMIVDHRMLNTMPHDGLADIFESFFSREFGGMNADHDQLFRVLRFKSTQLRDIMVAVYSTIGPEFEQDDFSAKGFQLQWMGGVDPFHINRKFRRTNMI